MKPYQQIPIVECGEPMVAIPLNLFARESSHPYQKLGAPYHLYQNASPYYLRQTVLDSLIVAQKKLQQRRRGWRIQIFDAYRPVRVQQFMVDYTFAEILKAEGLTPDSLGLTAGKRQAVLELVYQFWAVPSSDRATPPPHSTGAAVDVTLVDANGEVVNMGSPIDELSPRSYPHYFADSSVPMEREFARDRQLLREMMLAAGFRQHLREWWHFSLGDQMWAWLMNRENGDDQVVAKYGWVE